MAAPSQTPRKRKKVTPKPPKPVGTFARLRAEAAKATGAKPVEPYVLTQDVVIPAPETAEQQDAIMNIAGEGAFLLKDAKRLLEVTCGDQFPAVWELVRHEHVAVMFQLIQDMAAHFGAQELANDDDEVEEEDFPGGSEASPIL